MADIVSVPPPACDQPGRQSWDHPVTESIPDNGWRSAAARDGHYVSSVLAASLLAAVVEVNGVLEASRLYLDEEFVEADNCAELVEFRQDQLGNVAPADGDVVKWCDEAHVYCSACGEWIEPLHAGRPKVALMDHRETVHASTEHAEVSA